MTQTDWFREAHLGMMAHWGVYSRLGRGEWVLNRERIPLAEYRELARFWKADGLDAEAWAQMTEEAGARYFIFTAKHHDGFALWDTQSTEFSAPKSGLKRDIVGELTEAFHARGLKIGFFFSLADWMHPAYPTPYATDWPDLWRRDADRQELVDYSKAQIQELMQGYRPDIMWFDGAAPSPDAVSWESEEIIRICKEANPEVLLNNRLFVPGDFDALEVHLDYPKDGRAWESDYHLNQSWAWNPQDQDYKTPYSLWKRLCYVNAAGGNLLLNFSPDGQGRVPEKEQELLASLGRRIRRLDYHARPGAFGMPAESLGWLQAMDHTVKGNSVYLHAWGRRGDVLNYGSLRSRVRKVLLEDDGRELSFEQEASGRIRIQGLSATELDEMGYCIRLDLEEAPQGFGVGNQDLNF